MADTLSFTAKGMFIYYRRGGDGSKSGGSTKNIEGREGGVRKKLDLMRGGLRK